ncbi:hypothetical protein C1645_747593 [Glomus cerebriforme]|uniref:Uncharacterized protein n=1 Tax=Glomus cerebriforme TaxID=658196 RepID=A0A397TMK7_9GLOM|nr:hypothetical protein C1645_747593 [Glomus cerebriforme]
MKPLPFYPVSYISLLVCTVYSMSLLFFLYYILSRLLNFFNIQFFGLNMTLFIINRCQFL